MDLGRRACTASRARTSWRSRSSPRWRRAFLDYVRGAELIIHNADFDVEFLNMELALAGFAPLEQHVARITDTLLPPRSCTPAKNSLDALCERYFVDNSKRTLHGALADAYCSPSAISR